jgi:septum formation protein
MIYLASTSPRRKTLLIEFGISFRTLKPDYQEGKVPRASPSAIVRRHALAKAKSCAGQIRNGILIAADTIVSCGGQVIGKPKHLRDAFHILRTLQSRWHAVYTGVAIFWVRSGAVQTKTVFFEKTKVRLKSMSRREIETYFKKVNPLDKAGAYAIQSRRPDIVLEVRGSRSNAIGLPMETVLRKLAGKAFDRHRT